MSQPNRRRFELVLVDAGDASNVYRRLRAALKRLGRSYLLRCTSVREVPPPPADPDGGRGEPAARH